MDTTIVGRDQPRSPPLLWHRRDGGRRRPARDDRFCGSARRRRQELPAIKPGTNTSFGPLKQIDAGVLNVGYAEAGPADGPPSFFCTAGPTTFTALSMSRRCWQSSGLPGDRPVSARLRHDALSFKRNRPERPAVGARRRCHRLDGCAQDREGDRSPASIGARGPPTSSRRSGRSAARPWSPSAAI